MTKEEFDNLAQVFRPRLVKSAVNKWGSVGEDAVQEAFLRAFMDIDKFRGDCAFNSWIFSYAKIVMADWKRSEKLDYVDVDVFDLADGDDTFQSTYAQQWIDSLTPSELKSVIDDVGKTSKHRARRKYED
jgi:DNA-directed RNA polymerase specialized sigma24 family protein